jgi:4-diphosphocytidyl-2-C-methyl-D-erythritol kinase
VTVLQRVDLVDRIAVEPARSLHVEGFEGDTIVRSALEALGGAAGVEPLWAARIWKSIPVAAGLGGGSSDAATALRLANDLLPTPLAPHELDSLAATLGADVPFFLRRGPQLGTGDGSTLEPRELPQDYSVVLVLPTGVTKESTADVYRRFDERAGAAGFAGRRAVLLDTLASVRHAVDLAGLPVNDLVSSAVALDLVDRGAFRADVSGAGPVVYGLFLQRRHADTAARALQTVGRTWVTRPCP